MEFLNEYDEYGIYAMNIERNNNLLLKVIKWFKKR